jgi:hypothetical protein
MSKSTAGEGAALIDQKTALPLWALPGGNCPVCASITRPRTVANKLVPLSLISALLVNSGTARLRVETISRCISKPDWVAHLTKVRSFLETKVAAVLGATAGRCDDFPQQRRVLRGAAQWNAAQCGLYCSHTSATAKIVIAHKPIKSSLVSRSNIVRDPRVRGLAV